MSFYPQPFFQPPRQRRPPAPRPSKPKPKTVVVTPPLTTILSKEKTLPFSPVTNKANLSTDDVRRYLNTKELGSLSYSIHHALEQGHGSMVMKGNYLSVKVRVSPSSSTVTKLRHAMTDRHDLQTDPHGFDKVQQDLSKLSVDDESSTK
nr:MAG: putative nucleocapsid protein [Trout granulomatous virus]